MGVQFTNDNLNAHLKKHKTTLNKYRQHNLIPISCSKSTIAKKQQSGVKSRKKPAFASTIKRLKTEHLGFSPADMVENKYCLLDENPAPSSSSCKERRQKRKRQKRDKKMRTKKLMTELHAPSNDENQEEVPWMTAALSEKAEGPTIIKFPKALEHDHWEKEDDVMPVECVLSCNPPASGIKVENEVMEGNGVEESAMIITDNLDDRCQFLCEMCHKHVTSLRKHLPSSHHLSLKQYQLLYPTVYERKTHHRYLNFF
jgi:hypothetical protein